MFEARYRRNSQGNFLISVSPTAFQINRVSKNKKILCTLIQKSNFIDRIDEGFICFAVVSAGL